MSKKLNMLLVSAVVVSIAACSTPAKKEAVAECVFPNSDKAAPLWVCDGPVDGVSVAATGSFPKSAAGTAIWRLTLEAWPASGKNPRFIRAVFLRPV